jgi:hypothetical protein
MLVGTTFAFMEEFLLNFWNLGVLTILIGLVSHQIGVSCVIFCGPILAETLVTENAISKEIRQEGVRGSTVFQPSKMF